MIRLLRFASLCATIACLSQALHAQEAPARTASGSILHTYDTPHYILHTDISVEEAREADLRMTRMFEEYQRRTSSFTGQIKSKFPFYLFRNESDYIAAGGVKGSAGVYMEGPTGSKLMAIAGEKANAYTWHVVQHEGFHQFLAGTIKAQIPIWTNEGLAEYFGEALWTGDGFVTGLIPPDRAAEIKQAIKARKFKPFGQLMTMTDQEWGDRLEYSNYNQAWAMVHFLAHADNGKYQSAFNQFMQFVSRGVPAQTAWINVFGADTKSFEQRFANWWLSLPDEPTRSLYMKAMVQTEMSFLARAYLQGKAYQDAETFFKQYEPQALSLNRDLWLPPALFKDASATALRVGLWSIEMSGPFPAPPPRLICRDGDGSVYTGKITVQGNHMTGVSVDITPGTQHAAPNR
jgi:hypothetical protein